jgi:hypothetical protein
MNNETKQWWKSRTAWLGILAAAAGLLEVLHAWLVAGDFSASGIVLLLTGITGFALRFLTTEPIK